MVRSVGARRGRLGESRQVGASLEMVVYGRQGGALQDTFSSGVAWLIMAVGVCRDTVA